MGKQRNIFHYLRRFSRHAAAPVVSFGRVASGVIISQRVESKVDSAGDHGRHGTSATFVRGSVFSNEHVRIVRSHGVTNDHRPCQRVDVDGLISVYLYWRFLVTWDHYPSVSNVVGR